MSRTDAIEAALLLALLVGQVVSMLGPFHLTPDERPDHATIAEAVRAWFAGWRRRPRAPLSADDWAPRGGRMFFPSLTVIYLVCATIGALTADARPHLVEAAATGAGSLVMLSVIIGYVRRPLRRPAALPPPLPFPLRARGYDTVEVDRLLATLDSMSPADILRTEFTLVSWGYDRDLVDQAIIAAASSRRTP